ncbi:hypothetical protein FACS18945_2820 [Bacteroidia bacterium]|nr:hypothetical protein FACS18945_2820 [Bacteroidia bacterium]
MDGYCERTNAAYNRCYCSARLAQVDAAFKPAIEDILQQIVIAQGGRDNYLTDEELEDLWQGTFFQHVGINDMASLNEKLSSINWADTESRVRGQNAFVVGHEWCTQHLTGCYYMASQLRDAYRSEIARDCGTYEKYLEAMKLVAEQALASFE